MISWYVYNIMGGSESKTTINALSEQITNIASDTVQSCVTTTSQDQLINIVNTGWKLTSNINVEQQTQVSSSCFSDLNKQTELQNKIQNAIAQSSTASGVALISAFGASTADATANLRNRIVNNITMSNIQRNYNEIRQNQQVTYSNAGVIGFDTVNVTQGAKVFAAATLQQLDRAGIFNDIANAIDQKATATTENPLDFIAKIVGSVGSVLMQPIILFILFIAVICLGIVFVMYGGSSMFSGSTTTQQAVAEEEE